MKLTIRHYGYRLDCELGTANTHIEGSHVVKSRKDMKGILALLQFRVMNDPTYAINRLPERSMVREWRAHNILYALGLWRERTRSVDLNENTWPVRACYFVLSCLYLRK